MKQYILHTIDGALSGDVAAILKCVVAAFIIHFLYSKIQEMFANLRLKNSNYKDMTKTPSQSKLIDKGYSKSQVKTQLQNISNNLTDK